MKTFYSEKHRSHDPSFEVFEAGLRVPYLENPDRMDQILRALMGVDWVDLMEPLDFGLDPIRAVHDEDYLDFLASAWTEWQVSDVQDKSTVLPATFALRRQPQRPRSLLGRAGYYMMDLSACIVEGTYKAALSSANCALNAGLAVAKGDRSSFALCRPPGHHAGVDYAGGYCFINNAAVVANWLSVKGRVVVLDIDYHAGNGTQDIFYSRDDVLTVSIHADPDFEYPNFIGFSDERGKGRGFGYHQNYPLPAGTLDADYLDTLDKALGLIGNFKPMYMVVSAGMDIYADDPLGRIKVSTEGIGEVGKRIASLDLPTVVVLEGGYANEMLGKNILAFLGALK